MRCVNRSENRWPGCGSSVSGRWKSPVSPNRTCFDARLLFLTDITDAFYGMDDNPALANVDVMTDVSMAPTAFTRYTVAPTSASRSSRWVSLSSDADDEYGKNVNISAGALPVRSARWSGKLAPGEKELWTRKSTSCDRSASWWTASSSLKVRLGSFRHY
jgi:hypothetical protein